MTTTRIVLHGHHTGTLFSYFENEAAVANRIAFIQTNKPADERELRLALLKDVTGLLPRNEAWAAYDKVRPSFNKAWASCEKARAAYDKAWPPFDKARTAYDKARTAFNKTWALGEKAGAALDKGYAALNKAGAAYEKAGAAFNKAWASCEKARAAYEKARAAWLASFDADTFHRKYCHPNCPWDGKTIFAKGVGVEVLD